MLKTRIQKIKRYFMDVWNEVSPQHGKVTWPKQPEVVGSTIIVLISIFVIGLSLGLIDNILSKIFNIVIY